MGYTVEKVVRVDDREIVYRATAPTAHEAVSMLQLACGVAVIEGPAEPFPRDEYGRRVKERAAHGMNRGGTSP